VEGIWAAFPETGTAERGYQAARAGRDARCTCPQLRPQRISTHAPRHARRLITWLVRRDSSKWADLRSTQHKRRARIRWAGASEADVVSGGQRAHREATEARDKGVGSDLKSLDSSGPQPMSSAASLAARRRSALEPTRTLPSVGFWMVGNDQRLAPHFVVLIYSGIILRRLRWRFLIGLGPLWARGLADASKEGSGDGRGRVAPRLGVLSLFDRGFSRLPRRSGGATRRAIGRQPLKKDPKVGGGPRPDNRPRCMLRGNGGIISVPKGP
jgi:hypothetical protein